MINYIITQNTNIITIDDINLVNFVKRSYKGNEKGDNFTVFKKVTNLNSLTSANNLFNIATIVTCVEIACETTPYDVDPKDVTDTAKVFGLLYRKLDNPNTDFFIETIIANDIVSAGATLNAKVKDIEGVDPQTVSIFQVGNIIKTERAENIVNGKKYIIRISEQTTPGIMVKKGLDSFKEFNRKLYVCQLLD